jgi:hypothetical protein
VTTKKAQTETDELAAAYARIAELEQEVQSLREQLAAKPSGRSGYLVTTPAPFSGATAGVQFRRGQAFLPATETGKQTAEMLATEFGYTVQFVEDWTEIDQGEQISKTLIDQLLIPERR